MNNLFEKATRIKMRFNTEFGLINTEDLWDLKLKDLNKIAKDLNKELKTSGEEDFLEEKSQEDRDLKDAFDIVLHILNTKKDENKKKKEAAVIKAKKEKIREIISKKKDESLEGKSIEELEKELLDLDT